MAGILRTLKNHHILPRLQGFKFTTAAAGTAVLNIGSQEATIARAAAGKATITLGDKASREGVVVATPGADVASGSYACFDTAHNLAAAVVEMLSAAGVGDDGTGHCLTLAWDDTTTDRTDCNSQTVVNPAPSPRLLPFKVAAAGTIEIGKSQASVSVASSVYTLSFERDFGRAPVVVASPIAATRKAVRITANAATAVSIETYDPVGGGTPALEDNNFYALVLGWDTPDEVAGFRRSVQVPQIQPRIEAFRVDGAGTAAIDLGSTDAALTDNGTGDYTLTLTQPFLSEPVVIVTGKDHPAQLLAAVSESVSGGGYDTIQIGCFNKTTHAAVDDEVYVLVVGFDGSEI